MSSPVDTERKRELTVGAFAFAIVFGLFCFSIFVTGDMFWKSRQEVVVEFGDVMGLKKGDNVATRGMVVGEVSRLEYDTSNRLVRVFCLLNQKVEIKSDYEVTVVPTSILGGRHLRIYEGMHGDVLPQDAVLDGKRPNDLVNDASTIVSDVRRTLEEGLLDDLSTTVSQVREIVERVNSGKGTVGRLLNDEQVFLDLQASVASIKEVTQRLESGEGFLGKLMSEDEALYDDTKLLIQDVRAAVDDFRETSPILTFTSVLFGAF